jgi:hypothetical protein
VRKSQWKKPLTFTNQGLLGLVAWGGIEPPTQGFSIHTFLYFPLLIGADRINTNQRLMADALGKNTA